MTYGASGEDEGRRAHLRGEVEVRTEFRGASQRIWLWLCKLLAQRWEDEIVARRLASHAVAILSDLAKLRCLPDARPLKASIVLDALYAATRDERTTPAGFVERYVIRGLAGEPRSARTLVEITALIEAFLCCYAADYERGELTWVDELHAMVAVRDPPVSWRLEVPPTYAADKDATITLRIPVAALEAAGLLTGDQLILQPRMNGLWIELGPSTTA